MRVNQGRLWAFISAVLWLAIGWLIALPIGLATWVGLDLGWLSWFSYANWLLAAGLLLLGMGRLVYVASIVCVIATALAGTWIAAHEPAIGAVVLILVALAGASCWLSRRASEESPA
jgi:hypothetical protein